MKRFSLAAAALVAAANLHAAQPVGLKERTFTYGADSALAPLDETFTEALRDSGWTPLESSPGHIVAKAMIRFKYYAKIDVIYGSGTVRIRLLESKDLDAGKCEYSEGPKRFRGPCIHPIYYDWVDRIAANLPAAHAKIVAAASASAAGGTTDAAPATSMSSTFILEALLTGSSDEVALAGRALGNNPPPPVANLAAQLLHDSCSGKAFFSADAQAWLAKGLARSGTTRYRSVVEGCMKATGDPKLLAHLQIALDVMTAPADPFAPGAIDPGTVRTRVQQAMGSARAGRRTQAFYEAGYGTASEKIYEIVGYPDRVITLNALRTMYSGGPARVRVSAPQAGLVYEGAGVLILGQPSEADSHWVVQSMEHRPAIEEMAPELRARAVRQLLETVDQVTVRPAVDTLRKANIRDIASLDVIAQRISDLRDADDKQVVQGLALMCKILGSSGQARYKAFLAELGKSAGASGLRRHAEDQAELLPATTEPGFVPGRATAQAPG